MQHTRDCRTGRPVTYFALHRTGFFVPPTSPSARWALTPPFHPHPSSLGKPIDEGQFVFCDTVRQRTLTCAARACGEARAASCPMVSGLSSPNSYRARHYPRLGIKELGATTRPQSQAVVTAIGRGMSNRPPAARCGRPTSGSARCRAGACCRAVKIIRNGDRSIYVSDLVRPINDPPALVARRQLRRRIVRFAARG